MAANEVATYQLSHVWDLYANTQGQMRKMKNAVISKYTNSGEHGIKDFEDEISTYLPKSIKNASGKTTWEQNGKKENRQNVRIPARYKVD